MHKKHIPMRRCTGCYSSKPKSELIRIVKYKSTEEGKSEIIIDKTNKLPGRGAYLCSNSTCIKLARKAKRFERIFSCQIPSSVYDDLEVILSDEK